jgi:uncharacterized protein
MKYRQLGNTRLTVSIIGLGTEHLKNAPQGATQEIFASAIREGINYFDLVWAYPNIIDGLKENLQKNRAKLAMAFHLGSCISEGKYKRSRNPSECDKSFRIQLEQLNMDSAPILNIHYVPNLNTWKELNRKRIISLAENLKKEGLATALSVSTHDPQVVKQAAESGIFGSVMHQINILNHTYAPRNEALKTCSKLGVGVVAMKPFAGGELLKTGQNVKVPTYKTGWKTMTIQVPENSTPTRLLNYVLDQPGVCTTVIGASNSNELAADLAFLNASNEEKDYTSLIESFKNV